MDSARTIIGAVPSATVVADAALDHAAASVAEAHGSGSRFEQRAVRDALVVLTTAIRCITDGGTTADITAYSWSANAGTLLALLRRSLVAQADATPSQAMHCVRQLAAIEQLCAQLEHDAAAQFTEQFAGADALKLVVEMAHDMMSPLGAIQMLAERLQRGQSGPVTNAQERHLALVYSAAFGLSTMASDAMELARGGSRLLDAGPKPFSVSEVLRGVRDLVQPLAEERRLALRFSGPPVDRRMGHAAALSRVLLNLTTNAFKFTTVGSVTVQVNATENADELSFTVHDTGRGMSDTELQKVFSAFGTRANTNTRAFNSAGLGLAICHKLVSVMGGTLAVESQLNSGTTFSFVLPLPVV